MARLESHIFLLSNSAIRVTIGHLLPDGQARESAAHLVISKCNFEELQIADPPQRLGYLKFFEIALRNYKVRTISEQDI